MAELVLVEFKFSNRKAARAIVRIAELAAEIAEDQPWNDNAREIMRAAKYALSNITVEVRNNATR
jgi:hypothetical protein